MTQAEGVDVSTTQDVVPDLIAALFKADTEVVQPSEGPPMTVKRDPHLRLRRTLTPSSPVRGLKKYTEAQFMIQGSSGKRIKLFFSALGDSFQMDAYVWGAKEDEAEQRMVAVHGISPGVSRTRWHSLGERIGKTMNKTRFVALDWHSIDRTDEPQDAFLTMLPKHIFSVPSNSAAQEYIDLYPKDRREWARGFFNQVEECCPRSYQQGAEALKAVIEDGLGWGVERKPFILGVKSWSGGVGIKMLAEAARQGGSFKENITGAVIMHPACFLDKDECRSAVKDIPVLMCWAKDDQLVPYQLSSHFLVHDRVNLVAYDKGGHANFDGSNNLPNFDDDVITWLQKQV
jgi:hypothetical protein